MTELLNFQLVFKYNFKIYILLEDILAYKQLRGVVYLTYTHIDHKITVNNS